MSASVSTGPGTPLVTQIYGVSPAPVASLAPPSPRRSPRASPRSVPSPAAPTVPLPLNPTPQSSLSQGLRSVGQGLSNLVQPVTAGLAGLSQPAQTVQAIPNMVDQTINAATSAPQTLLTPGSTVGAPAPTTVSVPSLFFKTNLTPLSAPGSFPDLHSLVQGTSVEQKLVSSGFTPVDKVVVQEADGTLSAKYIKVATKSGQSALVELDQPGYVATSPQDLNVVEVQEATLVPYSTKNGTITSLGQEISGVAFVCEDNVCVVSRTEEVTPKETLFVVAEKANDKTATLDNSPVAYPIVRLSEIVASPEAVASSIEEAATQLRSKAYEAALEELKKAKESTKELSQGLNDFDRVQEDALRDLRRSIDDLKKVLAKYNNPLLIEGNREKYDKLLFNLRRRYEMLEELIQNIEGVAAKRHRLARITRKILDRAAFLREEFKHVGAVLNP